MVKMPDTTIKDIETWDTILKKIFSKSSAELINEHNCI